MIRRAAIVGATLSILCAASAGATVLVSGSGWQDDEITSPGAPSENSEWTFTISAPAVLSIVDAFIPGDVYTLVGTPAGTTTFYAGSAADIQASGPYGVYWTDASYSKIALSLSPGSYGFWIYGDGAGGLPAGLGVRLDAGPVPEPGSWAMMMAGLGVVGLTMRRRSRHAIAAC